MESKNKNLFSGFVAIGLGLLNGFVIYELVRVLATHPNSSLTNGLNQKKLEGVVLEESDSFSTSYFSDGSFDPTEKTYNNHNYIIWTQPDNKLVLVYTKDNSDPFRVLEQVKMNVYNTKRGEQAQLDIIKYVFGENYGEEVDADNLFVNVPIYEFKKVIED